MKRALFLSLVVLLILSACKKKNEEVVISLKGKWTPQSIVYQDFDNSTLQYSYTETPEKTTYDFQNNGYLVITDEYGSEMFQYKILNNSKLDLEGEIYEIKNLTAGSVVLYYRYDYSPGSYSEYSINLKR